jgi:hypothetical protein
MPPNYALQQTQSLHSGRIMAAHGLDIELRALACFVFWLEQSREVTQVFSELVKNLSKWNLNRKVIATIATMSSRWCGVTT